MGKAKKESRKFIKMEGMKRRYKESSKMEINKKKIEETIA
jgi:hypothetical protein